MNIKENILTAIKKIKIFIRNLVRKISEKIKEIVGKLKSSKVKIKLSKKVIKEHDNNRRKYKDSKNIDKTKILEERIRSIDTGNKAIKKENDNYVIFYDELTNYKEYYNKLVADLKMVNADIYSLEKSLIKEEANELLTTKLALAKVFLVSVNLAFISVKISKRASKKEIERENKKGQ